MVFGCTHRSFQHVDVNLPHSAGLAETSEAHAQLVLGPELLQPGQRGDKQLLTTAGWCQSHPADKQRGENPHANTRTVLIGRHSVSAHFVQDS